MIALLLALAVPLAAPADTTLPHYPGPVEAVEVGGRALAVYDTGGAGEPVVLVHGLGSNLSFWRATIPALEAAGRRVVALDLPGYGLSDKADVSGTMADFADAVAGVMDARGVDQADLVGVSMGGQIALTLALDRPARVRRLALLSPAGIETFTDAEAAMLKGLMTPAAIAATPPAQAEANVRANYSAYDADRDGWILEQRAAVTARDDVPDYAAANAASVAGMLDGPVHARLGGVAAPTLVVFGADDALIPNRYLHPALSTAAVAEAARAIPNAEVHLVSGAGHLVMLERPDTVNALLVGFLAEPAD
ncbi:alpha/beta fold hydrolase [Rubrivirga sp. S365]|uniref:Alpha/beta fold hydrolase n=1 Tax=Rubrivirga litoralis TaxID=3075598 RepID=A0ABU3BLG7_9BACT|nr:MULTISPECIES: alpha/beta fold hydrolase [unclassified Rubrivirga]MDT0630134.1 alpha/beta fold hydrolase [Rubrivirga sp. F394]MDT7855645.1 alpha/beta fold hydrolase [Rubrivirga sp. S365]